MSADTWQSVLTTISFSPCNFLRSVNFSRSKDVLPNGRVFFWGTRVEPALTGTIAMTFPANNFVFFLGILSLSARIGGNTFTTLFILQTP